jgi:peroxiredoxin
MANIQLGERAKPFSLQGVDGREHALEDYTDNDALVLIFSCNHCPYVRAWEDRMVQIQADYADRGVQLLAINANDAQKYPSDSFEAMKKRSEEKQFNFPYLHDETQSVASVYGAERTPEIFLFDSEQILRYHGAIDDNYDDHGAVQKPYLREALDAVLAGEEPAVASTRPVGCTVKWK